MTPRPKQPKKPRTKVQKFFLALMVIILLALAAGTAWLFWASTHQDQPNPEHAHVEFPDPIYSILTGEEIPDASLNQSPTYCIQIPNGVDGRPQAGLDQAAVVFEAIAEAGITRFAAVFQNPSASAIGPIRSLRPYYLNWDLPFDCAIIHQGGSSEALYALANSGALDLEEDDRYTWRELGSPRNWNNLFISSQTLANFSRDYNQPAPQLQAFPRLTPDQVTELLNNRTDCAVDANNADCFQPISNITLHISNIAAYDPVYTYNPSTNTYARSYADGEAHLVYDCAADLVQPVTTNNCGEPIQLNPDVVIAMRVLESKMADNYHEQIATIGEGAATIFQNGTVIEGTWSKSAANQQIIFRDAAGEVIRFAPGQVWISAVPQFGSVEY